VDSAALAILGGGEVLSRVSSEMSAAWQMVDDLGRARRRGRGDRGDLDDALSGAVVNRWFTQAHAVWGDGGVLTAESATGTIAFLPLHGMGW